ncbi:MAG: mechanosensitive ion channel [bacterium]|nr:mechanosensitive ion channel [bacterium]
MTTPSRIMHLVRCGSIALALLLAWASTISAETPVDHPLEPPDRSSPRATLSTFLTSADLAWTLYSANESGFKEPFRNARNCLDLSEIPPLVLREISAENTLLLKDVLDKIELPPQNEIPDAEAVATLRITRWTIPHTEITLLLSGEGEHEGEWLFSKATVARADEFYDKLKHLPYRPGKIGGHVEELRSGSDAIVLMKLVEAMPNWFRHEIADMMVWQWLGLIMLAASLAIALIVFLWLSRRWRSGRHPGSALAIFLVPLAMISTPIVGRLLMQRLFTLPGAPALTVRLLFSMVGYAGLAWLVATLLTRIGDLIVRFWFREARPLKKQLVRVIFRIATIVVVTGIALKALQILGVPVAGLVAGLGVGGLAIALAAKGTLENFIGGIILYADQPVKVGDVCRFGDRRGTVEDVGLRSVKIRTADRSIVTVPNGDFANMQLENLSERDQILLRETLPLRYETTRDQVKTILLEVETMLRQHSSIADERLRVRFDGFGDSSLEVELFAYAMTGSWPELLKIREDVLLKCMAIIEKVGTRLALPTRIDYVREAEVAAKTEKDIPTQS